MGRHPPSCIQDPEGRRRAPSTLVRVSVHSEHPFALPPEDRDAARQLRGRLVAPVTLWASGQGSSRVGLTVSSLLVALGQPARLIALLDPDSDLALDRETRMAITVLEEPDRYLAEAFAGAAPAPGGPFSRAQFEQTPWGPVLPNRSWVGVTWESEHTMGWSLEVVATIDTVHLTTLTPWAHVRGRYRSLAD